MSSLSSSTASSSSVFSGCLHFTGDKNGTTSFFEAAQYCKEAHNNSALVEAITEEVGHFLITMIMIVTIRISAIWILEEPPDRPSGSRRAETLVGGSH